MNSYSIKELNSARAISALSRMSSVPRVSATGGGAGTRPMTTGTSASPTKTGPSSQVSSSAAMNTTSKAPTAPVRPLVGKAPGALILDPGLANRSRLDPSMDGLPSIATRQPPLAAVNTEDTERTDSAVREWLAATGRARPKALAAAAQAVADEVRAAAVAADPVNDASRDLYHEVGTLIGLRNPELSDADVAAIVDAALALPAQTYEEAVAKRNTLTWRGQESDFAVAELSALAAEPAADPEVINALSVAVAQNQADWNNVISAFAAEYALNPESVPTGTDPIDDYIGGLADVGFAAMFEAKILHHARQGVAQSLAAEVTQNELDKLGDTYIAPIHAALDEGDVGGAIELLEELQDHIADDPLMIGLMNAARVDPAISETVLEVESFLNDALAPIHSRLLRLAPRYLDLTARNADDAHRPQRVIHELLRLANVLPPELDGRLVVDTAPIWQPVVEDGLMSAYWLGNLEGFDAAVGDYAEFFDSLCRSPGAEGALEMLADSAEHVMGQKLTVSSFGAHPFSDRLGQAAGEGRGAFLAVELINRMAAAERREDAFSLANELAAGVAELHERNLDSLAGLAVQQEQVDRIIESFIAFRGTPAPGELDLTALELELALANHLNDAPGYLEGMATVDKDALGYKRLLEALSGLESEAEVPQITGPLKFALQGYLSADTESGLSLQSIYLSNPAVGLELASDTTWLPEVAHLLDEPGIVDWATHPLTHAMPRNIRFALNTLRDFRDGVPGATVPEAKPWLPGGVVLFGGASVQQGATSIEAFADNEKLKGIRTGLQAGSFGLLANASRLDKAWLGWKTPTVRWAAFPMLLASDLVQLAIDARTPNTDGAQIAMDVLATTGSAGFSIYAGAERLALLRAGEGGKVVVGMLPRAAGWYGAVVYAAISVARYQYERVKASNRLENADQREALSFLGSLGPDGQLNPLIESSSHSDHDPKIYEGTPRSPEDIAYHGLPAEAVDILLNNSGNPADPVSALPALAAYAEHKGVNPRDFLFSWFGTDSPLSAEQQATLVEAAFGVDPQASGVSDEFLRSNRRRRSYNDEWTAKPGTVDELDIVLDVHGFPELDIPAEVLPPQPARAGAPQGEG